MPYCAAYGCNSNSGKTKGVSFHLFPSDNDSARRKAWVAYCRRADFKSPSSYSTLCSLHFSEKNYSSNPEFKARFGYSKAKPQLFKHAVPDIPLIVKETQQKTAPNAERGAFRKRRRIQTLKDVLDPIPLQSSSIIHMDEPEEVDLTPSASTSGSKQHFQCQVSISVPKSKVHLRTRRLQTLPIRRVHRAIQTKPPTRTVSTQCNLIVESQQQLSDESDVDMLETTEDPENKTSDPDYLPDEIDLADSTCSDVDEDVHDERPVTGASKFSENPHPTEERYFLVSETSLFGLLKNCSKCCKNNTNVLITKTVGTMVTVETVCQSCGSSFWSSQQLHNQMPLGNLMLASATVFSGSSPAKVLRLFECLNMPIYSRHTYDKIQSYYIVPSIQDMWAQYQEMLLDKVQGEDVVLGGDARCDSPGYSAKYGSYTLMDLGQKLILDVQLVQSNEVKSSCHMELAGLKRGIKMLEDQGCHIAELVTDRHLQVQKYMREEQSHITHLYDVWHVAKGVQKKLEAASKKKDCGIIRSWIKSISNHLYWIAAGGGKSQLMLEKWLSVINHVSNKHSGHGKLYTDCPHGPLDQERDWIKPGSRAYKAVREVVESSHLLRAIPKLSPVYQTYSLEVFHNVLNHLAPKSNHYFYPAMKARTLMAAFHFNENSQNSQAVDKAGVARWKISYPRAKKGMHSVAKPVNTGPTYEYVDFLCCAVFERRTQFPSYKLAKKDYAQMTADDPAFLTRSFVKVDKLELVNSLNSRYKLKNCL